MIKYPNLNLTTPKNSLTLICAHTLLLCGKIYSTTKRSTTKTTEELGKFLTLGKYFPQNIFKLFKIIKEID